MIMAEAGASDSLNEIGIIATVNDGYIHLLCSLSKLVGIKHVEPFVFSLYTKYTII